MTVGKGRGPIAVLGVTSLMAIGAIYYSHYSQVQEKAVMRAGVERDKERMRQLRWRNKSLQEKQVPSTEENSVEK